MVRGGSGNLEELSAALRRSIGKLVKIQHGPATVSAEDLLLVQTPIQAGA